MARALRQKWLKDDVTRVAAAVSFFGLLALAPLLLLAALLAQRFADPARVRDAITDRATQLLGAEGAEAVRVVMESADVLGTDPVVVAIGVATLLFSATNLVIQLQRALNEIWDVAARADRNMKGMLLRRLIAAGLVVSVVTILLLMPAFNALLDWVHTRFGLTGLGEWGDWLLLALLTAAACALLFKWLPDAHVLWRDVAVGAAFAAIAFTAAQAVMSRVLGSLTVTSAFGAASSVVIVLLWSYVSALILFLAAEITQLVAAWQRRPVVPLEHAVPRRREQEERKREVEAQVEQVRTGDRTTSEDR